MRNNGGVGMVNIRDHWLILRTSASRTLPLLRSLSASGFDVWTPRESQNRRTGRGKPTAECMVATAPSFLFARATHLDELLGILSLPLNPHPPFSLFRHAGRIPLVKDESLEPLRSYEARAERKTRRSHRYIYPRGTKVKTDQSAFVGMTFEVEGGNSKEAVAQLGPFRMKIGTWLLRPDGIQDDHIAPTGSATGIPA